MKLKKNEDQSVVTLPVLRIGNKTPMEGVTETKFGAQIDERMDHLEIVTPGDPSHNQPPNTDTIAYCQQDFAEKTLIKLYLVRLCLCLANTEVDAHSQLLNGTQRPQWRS